MQPEPHHSALNPTEWSTSRLLMQKWLARCCAMESMVNLGSALAFSVIGIIALVITSCAIATLLFYAIGGANVVVALAGSKIPVAHTTLFGWLFVMVMVVSTVHAFKTRWRMDTASAIDFSTAFAAASSLGWEFFSAGPILFILAAQDFQRYFRLSRLDVPHVSALLLWLYDKGGRAAFSEISTAFPKLNSIRVLPQLRDLPGIHWWPDVGEVSISDYLRAELSEALRREPKSPPSEERHTHSRPHFQHQKPVIEVDPKIAAWYTALNLPLFANMQQVKKRYRNLAKIHHPDARSANASDTGISNDEQMKRINEAYHNILKHTQNQAGKAN